jgi:hypothetical protein
LKSLRVCRAESNADRRQGTDRNHLGSADEGRQSG